MRGACRTLRAHQHVCLEVPGRLRDRLADAGALHVHSRPVDARPLHLCLERLPEERRDLVSARDVQQNERVLGSKTKAEAKRAGGDSTSLLETLARRAR